MSAENANIELNAVYSSNGSLTEIGAVLDKYRAQIFKALGVLELIQAGTHVLVPREPTEEMRKAGSGNIWNPSDPDITTDHAYAVYDAMIAAAEVTE